MKKTHTVVMLPTQKASPILSCYDKYPESKYLQFDETMGKHYVLDDVIFQHLYILSSEEIKEGDWAYDIIDKTIFQMNNQRGIDLAGDRIKKVIATTDKSLTFKTTEACKKSFDEGIKYMDRLPQIPESFLQVYVTAHNQGNTITEVQLELKCGRCGMSGGHKMSCKDEYLRYYIPKTREDNTVIMHEAKLYSRDEMLQAWKDGFNDSTNEKNYNYALIQWVEKNL